VADRLPCLSPPERVRPIGHRPPPREPKAEGLAATVRAETDGLGLEHAFDCVGHPGLLQQCIDLVQKGGSVIEVKENSGGPYQESSQGLMHKLAASLEMSWIYILVYQRGSQFGVSPSGLRVSIHPRPFSSESDTRDRISDAVFFSSTSPSLVSTRMRVVRGLVSCSSISACQSFAIATMVGGMPVLLGPCGRTLSCILRKAAIVTRRTLGRGEMNVWYLSATHRNDSTPTSYYSEPIGGNSTL
jgi:hypothetical protein